ncbi:MAG: hypothetical protein HY859_06830 [Caulobacterales bacterium]|nr:hypothetical protein [Caulobacterales bacterium]
MTYAGWEIVGRNDQELPFAKTVGDALRDLIRRRYRSNAAKTIERDWDLDARTARNVVGQGNVSERTLTKAVRAEGWELLAALGAELTGETYEQFVERKLRQAIREADDARSNLVHLRARREALDALTADSDAPGAGPDAEQVGAGPGDDRGSPDQPRPRRTGTAAD